jgi:hypothetical protein
MKIETNEIYTFKLTTGEEFVGKVTASEDSVLEINQPISTVISPQGLQMMPSLFSANLEKNVQLNTAALVMVATVREDVRNSYIQATTGIAPVSRQIITG